MSKVKCIPTPLAEQGDGGMPILMASSPERGMADGCSLVRIPLLKKNKGGASRQAMKAWC